jgi:hypothetical protein
MLLVDAVEEGSRKGVEMAPLCLPGRCFETDPITVPASILRTRSDISQKFFEQIFTPMQNLEPHLFGIDFQRIPSLLILLVGMDVRIEKITHHFSAVFFHPREGIDGAVGATDVKKDPHLLFPEP